MNRRAFLAKVLPLAGGVALASGVPLGRVWSFPSNLSIRNLWKPEPVFAGLDLGMSVDDGAAFVQTVRFTREQIAAIFRVPVKFLPMRPVGISCGVSPLQPLADFLRTNPRIREQILAKYSH